MQRDVLERLNKAELIELVLRLRRPMKTSRTSSKPPSTDRKERREQAKPGGAKPGHEGHSRTLSTDPDRVIDHAPQHCPCCRVALSPDLPSEAVSVHEQIELPQIKPVIEHHRRLAVQCPGCGARVVGQSRSRQHKQALTAQRDPPRAAGRCPSSGRGAGHRVGVVAALAPESG